MLAQLVASSAVAEEDFLWQVQNCPASIVLLLLAPVKSTDGTVVNRDKERRRALLDDALGRCECWGSHLLEGSAGAILYRKNRVDWAAVADAYDTGVLRYVAFQVLLKEGYTNNAKEIIVGVCYRSAHCLRDLGDWPEKFVQFVSAKARGCGVRFLGGFFDCGADQVTELAESAGASGTSPFAQFWREPSQSAVAVEESASDDEGPRYYTHPAYIIVLGPAEALYAEVDDQPEVPQWLWGAHLQISALARTIFPAKELPTWKARYNNIRLDLADLGQVKQKPAKLRWWKPGIHQLLLYVGTARQGRGARTREERGQGRRNP